MFGQTSDRMGDAKVLSNHGKATRSGADERSTSTTIAKMKLTNTTHVALRRSRDQVEAGHRQARRETP